METARFGRALDMLVGVLMGILGTAFLSLLLVGGKIDALDQEQAVRFEMMAAKLEVLNSRMSNVERIVNDITETTPRLQRMLP